MKSFAGVVAAMAKYMNWQVGLQVQNTPTHTNKDQRAMRNGHAYNATRNIATSAETPAEATVNTFAKLLPKGYTTRRNYAAWQAKSFRILLQTRSMPLQEAHLVV